MVSTCAVTKLSRHGGGHIKVKGYQGYIWNRHGHIRIRRVTEDNSETHEEKTNLKEPETWRKGTVSSHLPWPKRLMTSFN